MNANGRTRRRQQPDTHIGRYDSLIGRRRGKYGNGGGGVRDRHEDAAVEGLEDTIVARIVRYYGFEGRITDSHLGESQGRKDRDAPNPLYDLNVFCVAHSAKVRRCMRWLLAGSC